jgi:hypothetical protein
VDLTEWAQTDELKVRYSYVLSLVLMLYITEDYKVFNVTRCITMSVTLAHSDLLRIFAENTQIPDIQNEGGCRPFSYRTEHNVRN